MIGSISSPSVLRQCYEFPRATAPRTLALAAVANLIFYSFANWCVNKYLSKVEDSPENKMKGGMALVGIMGALFNGLYFGLYNRSFGKLSSVAFGISFIALMVIKFRRDYLQSLSTPQPTSPIVPNTSPISPKTDQDIYGENLRQLEALGYSKTEFIELMKALNYTEEERKTMKRGSISQTPDDRLYERYKTVSQALIEFHNENQSWFGRSSAILIKTREQKINILRYFTWRIADFRTKGYEEISQGEDYENFVRGTIFNILGRGGDWQLLAQVLKGNHPSANNIS